MRVFALPCALVLLATLTLTGCRSSSPGSNPGWSLSKLNPFHSPEDALPYPPTPSSLAGATSSGSPSAGYISKGSEAPSFRAETAAASDAYTPSALGPRVSYGQPAAASSLASPYAAPQQGPYQATGTYGSSGSPAAQSGGSTYGSTGGGNPYDSISGDRYASRGFSPTASGLPYGGGAGSPYEASSDRYGSSTAAPASPYGTSGNPLPSSLVGDRYASAAGSAAPSYSPGQSDYSPGQTGYGPGETPYAPGQTGYGAGQSDYHPGVSDYQPPAASPYQTPASSYQPPTSPYQAPTSPYQTPSSPYQPPAGSYTPPQPYVSPSASVSPASTSAPLNVEPYFRPGSTSDYAPSGTSSGTPIPAIRYPGSAGT